MKSGIARLFPLLRVLLLFAALASAALPAAALRPTALRTEDLAAPLGIDRAQPVFSWQVESSVRGGAWTAWQIQVASSVELLAADQPDLWDSGQIGEPDAIRATYAGKPLLSAREYFWRVRVWERLERPSPWSEPARFTTGLMDPSVIPSRSPWITDPGLLALRRKALGFRTPDTTDPHRPEWLQVDLGAAAPIETVRLHAIRHTVAERFGFPRRFKVELADNPQMTNPRVLLDHTDKDFNPWLNVIRVPGDGATGRYLRITATGLRKNGHAHCLALTQLEVTSDGKNIAAGRPVTSSAAVEDDTFWSMASVVDGLGVPDANPRANETLLLRREFSVRPQLKRALLFVSGLGHYTASVNGHPLDTARLTPGWTNPGAVILYDTHDVTAHLQAGRNALGLTLAGGMYNVAEGRYVKFVTPFRPLLAWAELHLEYSDGSKAIVPTGPRWRVHPGPTTFANIYGGEDHDARLDPAGWDRPGFDDSTWTPAAPANWPGALLRGTSHAAPPLRPHEHFTAQSVREIRPGVHVHDFGQNAAMMPRLRVTGPAGAVVRLIPAELLRADGSVDRRSVGGNAWWQYTLRGDPAGETWEPSFFYHGARYLQAELSAPEGADLPRIDELASVVVHSDSPPAGEFSCSNELLNRIHGLVRWAQRSNLAHVLTDCPHRERLGWLEQYHLNGPALRYNFDLARLFRKTFRDMAGGQTSAGLIPSTAPEYVIFPDDFRDSPEWGSALILAAWQQFVFTGDDQPLRDHYEAMQRYFTYLGSRETSGAALLDHGLGDWYDLGPNRPGVAQLTPISLTASAIYYEDARTLARIAAHLGHGADAIHFQRAAADIATDFNQRFLDQEKKHYATGSQTAQAMPLVLGLAPKAEHDAVLAALTRDIEAHGDSHTAGDVGYRYVLRALADAGRSDLVYRMINQSEKPGYGFQLARGATSLTEAWDADPRSSQNHFMLGQINEWFFHDLAGIQPDPAAPGFKQIVLAPAFLAEIDWVKASHRTPYGLVRSEWRRAGGRLHYRVTIPPGATGTVRLPATKPADLRESGRSIEDSPCVRLLGHDSKSTRLSLAAGDYEFEIPISR